MSSKTWLSKNMEKLWNDFSNDEKSTSIKHGYNYVGCQ